MGTRVFSARHAVIGMLHLPALAGSALHRRGESVGAIGDRMLRDADALVDGGVDGLMIENFGDVPFFPGRVPASTVADIAVVAARVRERFSGVPLGINVLRNDGVSAMAIAAAVGAAYVRVNVLCGARLADQGILQGIAHDLLRERARLGAEGVAIFADVDVKHSAALAAVSLESEVEDTLHRGLADALIVSGSGTGKATDLGKVERVKEAAGAAPVFIGSGATLETVRSYLEFVDGFIIGTGFKVDGRVENAVDPARVEKVVRAVKG